MRLRLLGSAGDDLSGTGPLTLVLGHVVAELSALGGMIHLCDTHHGGLRLVASIGLPESLAARWETLTEEDSAAPVSCLRYGTHAWTPSVTFCGWSPSGSHSICDPPAPSAWARVVRSPGDP
ncbi:hypothetical protein [Streptomyces asiaticus]|uniref:hypothetical protein n=1 Tax=Streptomyces asiaticus TaxID=114695 RepID=UPI003F66E365